MFGSTGVPFPPYCYWAYEPYWVDARLNGNVLALHEFDEIIEAGPLVTAWDVTVNILSSVMLAPQPAHAARNIQHLDVKQPCVTSDSRSVASAAQQCRVMQQLCLCSAIQYMQSTSCTCAVNMQNCIIWHTPHFSIQ